MESYGGTFEYWFSDSKLANASASEVVSHAQRLGQGMFWTKDDLRPLHDYWFYVRSVNVYGKSVFVEVSGQPKDGALEYLDTIKGKILKTHLGQALQKQIDSAASEASVNEVAQKIEDARKALESEVGDISNGINRLEKTVADDKEATSRAIEDISSKTVDNATNITSEVKTRADADKALGERITQVKSETVDSVAQALDQVKTVSEAQQASGSRIQSLEASAAIDNTPEGLIEQALALHEQGKERRKAEAKIIHEQTVIANQQEAVAKEQTTLKAMAGENTAQLQQVSEVQADVNGKLSSMTTIKSEVTVNGQRYVAGIALGVDSEGSSQFLADANRMAVLNTENGQTTVPFVVQNGQVFINELLVNYAAITLAKIGELRSANYVPGRSGLRMAADGSLEINASHAGGRTTNNGITESVYDENGVLRYQKGFITGH